jgi:hypothetical protein
MRHGLNIVITRHWHNPKIQIVVDDQHIGLTIALEDFLEALREEIESVTWTFKKSTWDAQFDAAAERVIEKIKGESARVV